MWSKQVKVFTYEENLEFSNNFSIRSAQSTSFIWWTPETKKKFDTLCYNILFYWFLTFLTGDDIANVSIDSMSSDRNMVTLTFTPDAVPSLGELLKSASEVVNRFSDDSSLIGSHFYPNLTVVYTFCWYSSNFIGSLQMNLTKRPIEIAHLLRLAWGWKTKAWSLDPNFSIGMSCMSVINQPSKVCTSTGPRQF